MFESILLPINSIEVSAQKTQTAINFSRNKIYHLTFLSIAECQSSSIKVSKTISYALSLVKDLIIQDGIMCQVLHRRGKPELVICKIAEELNIDLIVMGAKGIDLLNDSQSTTSKVLAIAPCPVLIIP